MSPPDPRRSVTDPIRRALDAILLRWISVYVLAASVAVWPVICQFDMHKGDLVHAILPAFLVGFIAVHLLWRHPARRKDGWQRAWEADPGDVRLTILVGGASMAGVLLALIVIFCPLGDPMALQVALGIWLPILAPLYAGAVWVAVDCSVRRLSDSAEDSDRLYREYWRRVSQRTSRPVGRQG